MKLFILLLFISLNTFAKPLEIGVSTLTMHTVDRSSSFKNKIDSQGMFMSNYVFYFTYDRKYTFLQGQDSIGSPMVGLTYTYANKWVFGAYTINKQDWLDEGWQKYQNIPLQLGFVPVIGYKYTESFRIDDKRDLKLNILFTPSIINLSFGVEFD